MVLRRKCNGAKHETEAWAVEILGRGALCKRGSRSESTGGFYTSENAGISSERMVRIHPTENLRFPEEGSSAQGKSGPKARPKGVVDGKQVKDSCTAEMY